MKVHHMGNVNIVLSTLRENKVKNRIIYEFLNYFYLTNNDSSLTSNKRFVSLI